MKSIKIEIKQAIGKAEPGVYWLTLKQAWGKTYRSFDFGVTWAPTKTEAARIATKFFPAQ